VTQRKKTKGKGKGGARMLPVLHPDAAGIDVGAEEVFVAVPHTTVRPSRYARSRRSLEIFTILPTGCSPAEYGRWPWSPQVSTLR
jgi:hypothetical protein